MTRRINYKKISGKTKSTAKSFWGWYGRYTVLDLEYVAKTEFWSKMNFGISSLLPIGLALAFANLVPRDVYGSFRYLMSLAGALGFLIITGLDQALSKAVAGGYDRAFQYAVKRHLRADFVFFLALSVFSVYYAVKENSAFSISLLALGLTAPLFFALRTYRAYLVGKGKRRLSSVYSVAANLIYILVMIIVLFLTDDLLIIVSAYVFSRVLSAFIFYRKTIRDFKPAFAKASAGKPEPGKLPAKIKKFLRKAEYLSIIDVFATLSLYIDKILVFHLLGPVQLAIYSLAVLIPERLRTYSRKFLRFIPSSKRHLGLGDMRSFILKKMARAMGVGAILAFSYIILAPWVFRFLMPRYRDAVFYSQVFSLLLIFSIPTSYLVEFSRFHKLAYSLYLRSLAAHFGRIILFIVFGALWGIWGIILAVLMVYALSLFYHLLLIEMEIEMIIERSQRKPRLRQGSGGQSNAKP